MSENQEIAYRYPSPARDVAERIERLAASEYSGARTADEEQLVQHWVMTGFVDGHRREA